MGEECSFYSPAVTCVHVKWHIEGEMRLKMSSLYIVGFDKSIVSLTRGQGAEWLTLTPSPVQ